MFSGIIEVLEKPIKVEKKPDSLRLTLPVPSQWNVQLGDSISLDGTCCTVETLNGSEMTFFLMAETLKKTTFGAYREDHEINMEKPLTLNTLIGGHLVSGHVDTVGTVQSVEENAESKTLSFSIQPEFTKYIIYKGSICINGVSLTVVSVDEKSFRVSLIPYTLEHTNLGSLKNGDSVNIEIDLIAKYLEKLVVSK